MPTSVVFPKANVERTSGEISSWSVGEGDKVVVGDTLFEVEDDKAVVEVDSPADGYIGGLAAIAEEIDVGSVVATIYASKEEMESAAPGVGAAAAEPVLAHDVAAAPTATPMVATVPAAVPKSTLRSTPLARRIARENGVSIEGLKGTGPKGRIQKRDVLAMLAAKVKVSTPTDLTPNSVVAANSNAALLSSIWYQKGEGVPVVFLHGFGADYTSWGGLLSGARYDWPAFALDLPCHGGSGSELPADLDGIAASVESTLQAHGITELMFAAHSFGAAVAARLASRGILRIRGMCLFAPAGLTPEINPAFVAAMLRARSAESLKPWLIQLVDDPALIGDIFLERSVASRASEEAFEALQLFGMRFFPDGTQRFNVLDDLAEYLGPLRVVYGRQDQILPVEATRNLPGNVALHLWDNCGHMPHFEHRREALRVLEEVRRSV